MSINLVDNFSINSDLPIDSRLVVDDQPSRESIEYKYDGLRVFQLDNRIHYIWNTNTDSWEEDGNFNGSGTTYSLAMWESGKDIGDSPVTSYTKTIYEDNAKVLVGSNGFGGSEAFQVNSNYSDDANVNEFGTSSMPFVIHKGGKTTLGDNWYYEVGSGEKFFDDNFSSSVIDLVDGGFIFRGKTPSDTSTSDQLYVNSKYVKPATYIALPNIDQPDYQDNEGGAIYFNDNDSKIKAKEDNKWYNVANLHTEYIAQISQYDINEPNQLVLQSTIGTGYWSFDAKGMYSLHVTDGFKGLCPDIYGPCSFGSTYSYHGYKDALDSSIFHIDVTDVDGYPKNSELDSTLIEIRVWGHILVVAKSSYDMIGIVNNISGIDGFSLNGDLYPRGKQGGEHGELIGATISVYVTSPNINDVLTVYINGIYVDNVDLDSGSGTYSIYGVNALLTDEILLDFTS